MVLNKTSFLGPPITRTIEQHFPRPIKSNGTEMATGPYNMKTPSMSKYSQQLWVIAKVKTENTDGR